MAFLSSMLWGVRLFVWLYVLVGFFLILGVLLYWNRHRIHEKYIKVRYPERVIKVVLHYTTRLYKVFWRLIPTDREFVFDDKIYVYDDKAVLEQNDFYSRRDDDREFIMLEGKRYDLKQQLLVKGKDERYPEIHYVFNNPSPINFGESGKRLEFSSLDLKDFKENDLWKKLLTMTDTQNALNFVLILVAVNLIATLFIIAKLMGWIK